MSQNFHHIIEFIYAQSQLLFKFLVLWNLDVLLLWLWYQICSKTKVRFVFFTLENPYLLSSLINTLSLFQENCTNMCWKKHTQLGVKFIIFAWARSCYFCVRMFDRNKSQLCLEVHCIISRYRVKCHPVFSPPPYFGRCYVRLKR